MIRRFQALVSISTYAATAWEIDIGYERFLAPEIFFQPEIYSSEYVTPLPELVVGWCRLAVSNPRFFT